MPFDIEKLEDENLGKWVPVGLEDMEVLIRRVGPRESERLRQKLVRRGIFKKGPNTDIVPGREKEFFKEFSKTFVIDWKNVKIGEDVNPPFDEDRMAKVVSDSDCVFKAIREAVDDEASFFSQNGAGFESK